MFNAATLAVIIASLVVGFGLIATSRNLDRRQLADSLFMQGLAFIALAILVTLLQQLFNGGST